MGSLAPDSFLRRLTDGGASQISNLKSIDLSPKLDDAQYTVDWANCCQNLLG